MWLFLFWGLYKQSRLTLCVVLFFCRFHWKTFRCIFGSGHMVDSLGAWFSVISVCTVFFHSDVTFGVFWTSVITWGCTSGVSAFILLISILTIFLLSGRNYWICSWFIFIVLLWVHLLEFLCVCFHDRYPRRICIGEWSIFWYDVLLWFSSWFTCQSFSWYDPLTGTIGGTAREVVFSNISDMDITSSLCEFPGETSGLAGAVLCSKWIRYCG